LGWQAGKAALLHPELCTYCAGCEDICPVAAIELPYLIVRGESNEKAQNE
jgi:ferredoxin